MTKTKLRSIALAIALVTGAGGVVHAQSTTPTAPATTQATPDQKAGPDGHRGHFGHHDRHGHHGRGDHGMHRGGHAGGFPMMLGHLKSKLNLTSEQETRWNAAESQRREVGKAMGEQRAASREALKTQLKSTGPADFRAISAQREASRAALKPKMDAARDAWLVVYDSLDAKQKQIVTDAFKHSLARAEHRGGPRGEHRGDFRGDGKVGPRGDMKRSAPPAADPAAPVAPAAPRS